MKRLFTVMVTAIALFLGSGNAQYGYPAANPAGYPYGYDPSAYMYANPYGYQPMMPGAGGYYDPNMGAGSMDAYFAELMRQGDAQMAAIQQQIDQTNVYFNQVMAEINRYYIDLYRTTTGDQISSDETALYYGQFLHCQKYPDDCAAAARNSQARAAAASAGYAASNDAWFEEQLRKDQAHEDFIRTVIRGEGEYTSTAGETQVLPFAPSQNSYYQTPAGLPLVFDAATNTWYQIEANGNYTPYYGAP